MKPNKLSEEEGSTVEAKPRKTQQRDEDTFEAEPLSLSLAARIECEVSKLIGSSRLFVNETDDDDEIALFHRNEVLTCSLLGNGAFSEVYQIWGFRLANLDDPQQAHAREALQSSVIDPKGNCNYVMKHLRHDLRGDFPKFIQSAADMVMEAKFLTKLNHPNIVKLQGWSGGTDSYASGSHDGFFLILDRLDHTLSQRMSMWVSDPKCKEVVYSREMKDHLQKVDIAFQIAKGLEYLHRQDIIFRDLKPDNIGFRGNTVQIFDFGLCRELPEARPDATKTFHMSGVGTRRYMAPEIFLGQHYNLKADVYSWTIVFHAMMSLSRPYGVYNADLHRLYVCEQGVRPTVLPEWPAELQQLCRSGWAHDPSKRPTMTQIRERLQSLLQSYNGVDATMLPGQSIIEASLDMMGNCTNVLCKDFNINNKHAANMLRLLEMHMVGDSKSSIHNRFRTKYPHLQHLRSAYL